MEAKEVAQGYGDGGWQSWDCGTLSQIVGSLNLLLGMMNLAGKYFPFHHFVDGDAEAQRSKVTCLRSHS